MLRLSLLLARGRRGRGPSGPWVAVAGGGSVSSTYYSADAAAGAAAAVVVRPVSVKAAGWADAATGAGVAAAPLAADVDATATAAGAAAALAWQGNAVEELVKALDKLARPSDMSPQRVLALVRSLHEDGLLLPMVVYRNALRYCAYHKQTDMCKDILELVLDHPLFVRGVESSQPSERGALGKATALQDTVQYLIGPAVETLSSHRMSRAAKALGDVAVRKAALPEFGRSVRLARVPAPEGARQLHRDHLARARTRKHLAQQRFCRTQNLIVTSEDTVQRLKSLLAEMPIATKSVAHTKLVLVLYDLARETWDVRGDRPHNMRSSAELVTMALLLTRIAKLLQLTNQTVQDTGSNLWQRREHVIAEALDTANTLMDAVLRGRTARPDMAAEEALSGGAPDVSGNSLLIPPKEEITMRTINQGVRHRPPSHMSRAGGVRGPSPGPAIMDALLHEGPGAALENDADRGDGDAILDLDCDERPVATAQNVWLPYLDSEIERIHRARLDGVLNDLPEFEYRDDLQRTEPLPPAGQRPPKRVRDKSRATAFRHLYYRTLAGPPVPQWMEKAALSSMSASGSLAWGDMDPSTMPPTAPSPSAAAAASRITRDDDDDADEDSSSNADADGAFPGVSAVRAAAEPGRASPAGVLAGLADHEGDHADEHVDDEEDDVLRQALLLADEKEADGDSIVRTLAAWGAPSVDVVRLRRGGSACVFKDGETQPQPQPQSQSQQQQQQEPQRFDDEWIWNGVLPHRREPWRSVLRQVIEEAGLFTDEGSMATDRTPLQAEQHAQRWRLAQRYGTGPLSAFDQQLRQSGRMPNTFNAQLWHMTPDEDVEFRRWQHWTASGMPAGAEGRLDEDTDDDGESNATLRDGSGGDGDGKRESDTQEVTDTRETQAAVTDASSVVAGTMPLSEYLQRTFGAEEDLRLLTEDPQIALIALDDIVDRDLHHVVETDGINAALATTVHTLAYSGRHDEAIDLFRRALQQYRNVYETDPAAVMDRALMAWALRGFVPADRSSTSVDRCRDALDRVQQCLLDEGFELTPALLAAKMMALTTLRFTESVAVAYPQQSGTGRAVKHATKQWMREHSDDVTASEDDNNDDQQENHDGVHDSSAYTKSTGIAQEVWREWMLLPAKVQMLPAVVSAAIRQMCQNGCAADDTFFAEDVLQHLHYAESSLPADALVSLLNATAQHITGYKHHRGHYGSMEPLVFEDDVNRRLWLAAKSVATTALQHGPTSTTTYLTATGERVHSPIVHVTSEYALSRQLRQLRPRSTRAYEHLQNRHMPHVAERCRLMRYQRAVLKCLVNTNQGVQALELLRRMEQTNTPVDPNTLSSVMRAFGKARSRSLQDERILRHGDRVAEWFLASYRNMNVAPSSRDIGNVVNLFTDTARAAERGALRHAPPAAELYARAIAFVDKMEAGYLGFPPIARDGHIYASLLHLAASTGNPDELGSLMKEMKSRQVALEARHFFPLIDLCLRRGDMQGAQQAFADMTGRGIRPPMRLLTLMIRGYVQLEGDIPEAVTFVQDVFTQFGVRPNHVTLLRLYCTALTDESLQEAERLRDVIDQLYSYSGHAPLLSTDALDRVTREFLAHSREPSSTTHFMHPLVEEHLLHTQ